MRTCIIMSTTLFNPSSSKGVSSLVLSSFPTLNPHDFFFSHRTWNCPIYHSDSWSQTRGSYYPSIRGPQSRHDGPFPGPQWHTHQRSIRRQSWRYASPPFTLQPYSGRSWNWCWKGDQGQWCGFIFLWLTYSKSKLLTQNEFQRNIAGATTVTTTSGRRGSRHLESTAAPTQDYGGAGHGHQGRHAGVETDVPATVTLA